MRDPASVRLLALLPYEPRWLLSVGAPDRRQRASTLTRASEGFAVTPAPAPGRVSVAGAFSITGATLFALIDGIKLRLRRPWRGTTGAAGAGSNRSPWRVECHPPRDRLVGGEGLLNGRSLPRIAIPAESAEA